MGTKNFSDAELSCPCGCGNKIEDEDFLNKLQNLRDMYGEPMFLTSAFRCPDYNEKISKTGRTGPHTIAAVDVAIYGKNAHRLLWMALAQGFTGIGLNQKGAWSTRFMHIDLLRSDNRPWIWTY